MNVLFPLNFGLLAILLLPVAIGTATADDTEIAAIRQVSAEGIRHSFLVSGTTTTAIIGEDNAIIWELPGYSREANMLENGNILVSDAKVVREFAAGTHDVVWKYRLSRENAELGTVATRLANGNTMIVEQGPKPRILEVAPDGTIAVEVALQPETDDKHMQTRMARKRSNGNYLAPHLLAFKIKEYTPAGEVVRSIATDLPEFGGRDAHNWPFTAIELENGNIYADLTHGDKVAEFDAEGNLAWSCTNEDVDGRFKDPCGAQRLPNGNTVIGCYGQTDPTMPKVIEITPEKEVVWEFFHPEIRAHEIHVLTTNGVKVSPVMR